MKTRHVQEMACWQPRRVDPEAARFFRGVLCGVALSGPLWIAFLLWVLP